MMPVYCRWCLFDGHEYPGYHTWDDDPICAAHLQELDEQQEQRSSNMPNPTNPIGRVVNLRRVDSGVLLGEVTVIVGASITLRVMLYRVRAYPPDQDGIQMDVDMLYHASGSIALDQWHGPLIKLDTPEFQGLYVGTFIG